MRDLLEKISVEVPLYEKDLMVCITDEYLCIPFGKDIYKDIKVYKNDSSISAVGVANAASARKRENIKFKQCRTYSNSSVRSS